MPPTRKVIFQNIISNNFEDSFTLDNDFDNLIDRIYNFEMNYLLNENNSPKIIDLYPRENNFNSRQIIDTVINNFFSSGKPIHKNMVVNDGLCENANIKLTLDEEIEFEEKNSTFFQNKIDRKPENRGKSNTCVIRLNNVLPIQVDGKNFIVKRLTRFSEIDKHNYNFIGSACKSTGARKDETTKQITGVSKMRNDECEYKELFTCLVFSHYLRKMYGEMCPKIYGILLIPKLDPYVKKEIYILQEPMSQTAEDWLRTDKTMPEIKNFIVNLIYLHYFLHHNRIPQKLVERYKYIIFPKSADNYSQWLDKTQNLYLSFYDCKYDNVMIDTKGNWRIIDIDGLLISDEIKLNDPQKNPLLCAFNDLQVDVSMYQTTVGPNLIKFFENTNPKIIIGVLDNFNDREIEDYFTDNQITVNKIKMFIGELKNKINYLCNGLCTIVDEPGAYCPNPILQTQSGGYYKKYLKYKNKYLDLKKNIIN
jgi:hypothetical protein